MMFPLLGAGGVTFDLVKGRILDYWITRNRAGSLRVYR